MDSLGLAAGIIIGLFAIVFAILFFGAAVTFIFKFLWYGLPVIVGVALGMYLNNISTLLGAIIILISIGYWYFWWGDFADKVYNKSR